MSTALEVEVERLRLRCEELTAQSMRWEKLARDREPRIAEERQIADDMAADAAKAYRQRDALRDAIEVHREWIRDQFLEATPNEGDAKLWAALSLDAPSDPETAA